MSSVTGSKLGLTVASLVMVAAALVNATAAANAQTPGSRGFWTDPQTKLMWDMKDNGYEGSAHGLLSQAAAAAYCRSSRLAGFRDWRLPTIDELETIYDRTVEGYHAAGGIMPSGDPSTTRHSHMYEGLEEWSSSKREGQEAFWEFDFDHGNRSTAEGGGGLARALCVRGVRAPASISAMDMSKYVSADGITIPRGGPGVPRANGLYWEPIKGEGASTTPLT